MTTNDRAAPVIASPAAAQGLLSRKTKFEPSAALSQWGDATARVLQSVLDWFERRRWVKDYERAQLRCWGPR